MIHAQTQRLTSVIKFGIGFLLVAFIVPVFAFELPAKPIGYVSDFAGILSEQTKTDLETKLSAIDPQVTEVAVVTVKTLEGRSIEEFANTLFRYWGIGQKDTNNGVLFLIAPTERTMRIEVGYGMEGTLTDVQTFRIQEDIVKPYFKIGDYDTGIVNGTDAIISIIDGTDRAPKSTQTSFDQLSRYMNTGSITLLIFVAIMTLRLIGILAPTKSWWLGGLMFGIFGSIFVVYVSTFSMIVSVLIVIGSIFIGFLFDFIVSRFFANSGNKFGGIFGGGRGGGGGGFGGFGGGSSGGGGSSSSW